MESTMCSSASKTLFLLKSSLKNKKLSEISFNSNKDE